MIKVYKLLNGLETSSSVPVYAQSHPSVFLSNPYSITSASYTSPASLAMFFYFVLSVLLIFSVHGIHSARLGSSGLSPRYVWHHDNAHDLHCSDFFGHPDTTDCEYIVQKIIDHELGNDDEATWRSFTVYWEFLNIGGQSQYRDQVEGTYSTPIYWSHG